MSDFVDDAGAKPAPIVAAVVTRLDSKKYPVTETAPSITLAQILKQAKNANEKWPQLVHVHEQQNINNYNNIEH